MDKDIWYITFNNIIELALLEEALKAYDYFNESNQINVIINELNNDTAEKLRNRILGLPLTNIDINVYLASDILTEHELVKIHHTRVVKDFPGFGWITQQILKLAVYRKSKAKFSYIFDCKNIPIKPNAIEWVDHSHNFMPNNDPDLQRGYQHYKNYLVSCGILKNDNLVYAHRSVNTPFIFENSVLCSMFENIDVFALLFLDYRYVNTEVPKQTISSYILVSEIILYYAYIDYQDLNVNIDNKDPSIYYWVSDDYDRNPWVTTSSLKEWIEKNRDIIHPDIIKGTFYYFTAHRKFLTYPSISQFRKFISKTIRDHE